MSKKKTPLRPNTVKKFTSFLLDLQETLPKNQFTPIHKMIEKHHISTYVGAVLTEQKYVTRLAPGQHVLKHLKFTEKDIENIVRATQKRQNDVARQNRLKKKAEAEKVIAEKKASTPSIEEIQKEQKVKEEIMDKTKHVPRNFEEMIYGKHERKTIPELNKELQTANQFLHEAEDLIRKKDEVIQTKNEEIEMMRGYIQHLTVREMHLISEMKVLKNEAS